MASDLNDLPNLPKLFDGLKKGQVIRIAVTSCMGMETGELHERRVGRRSHSKKYGVTSIRLDPMNGPPPPLCAAVTLRKRLDRHGEVYVAAAHGNSALTIRNIEV